MAIKGKNTDPFADDYVPATPITRLKEGRWPLVAGVSAITCGAVFYDVPVLFSVASGLLLAGATAYVPRKARMRKRVTSGPRAIPRMWPGTGMKVTADALANPCFIADGRGIIRYVNKAAAKNHAGVKPGDPLSFSLRAPSLLEAFDRVCVSASPERIVWMEKVPTEAWYEAHLSPIYLPGSSGAAERGDVPDFVLVVINDLTEQRRLERMRTDFVANASHELRTPLASLTGFIETLQGPAKEDDAARERFLNIMLEQAGRMRRLIDDILSLSRVELKAHVRPDTPVDLGEVVRHTVDSLGPLARELEVAIEVHFSGGLAEVKGDRDELIEVVENLIENALKYGSAGKRVDVRIEAEKGPGDGISSWGLHVTDYGEGIPPEHLPRLTERFYRVDVDSSRVMRGTGLGLAIVKHILTRHRARLEIVSSPGKGATFSVRFPPD
ncbi:two-component sensor histidine kinase [Roseibium aquae]|uniref:histidine kinase n=1 Tax=Roseibium aquae TaxID=1323746 RepID=A0A916TKN5_9HYPH|nr:ATP-binding protein [Roseibium aquae]GGB51370.1 two-component sensor histidine kinase [Roseibium aquae]